MQKKQTFNFLNFNQLVKNDFIITYIGATKCFHTLYIAQQSKQYNHLFNNSGYTDGTKLSQDVFVKEGQKIEVRFRGNLQPDEEVEMVTAFNSQLKTQINMYIAEIDKYAQKSFSSYRGFAQFYTEGRLKVYVLYDFVISYLILIKLSKIENCNYLKAPILSFI